MREADPEGQIERRKGGEDEQDAERAEDEMAEGEEVACETDAGSGQ